MAETKQTIKVSIQSDDAAEPKENFKVLLSAPVNAALGKLTHTCAILNDDPSGAIELGSAIFSQGEASFCLSPSAIFSRSCSGS